MRSIRSFAILALAILIAPVAVLAQPGTEPEKVVRASALETGHGVVVISVRSELYLDEPLHVYFLREGGRTTNDPDVVRFERRQGFLAFGNDTTKYKVRSYQLPVGRYRLVAHGINCPKVPAPDERCLVDVSVLGVEQTRSYPSRGYGEESPVFEVKPGTVTIAGDFALTGRNTIEWSEIPAKELRKTANRFSALEQGPGPEVPGEFYLKYGLYPREYSDDAGRRF